MERQQQILFPFSHVSKDGIIVLYGAGDVGQIFYRQLEKTAYCQVVAWMDKRFRGVTNLPYPLADPAAIVDLVYDHVVIATSNPKVSDEIARELVDAGVPRDRLVHAHDCLLTFNLCHLSDAGQFVEQEQNRGFARLLAGAIGAQVQDLEGIQKVLTTAGSQKEVRREFAIGVVGTGLMSGYMADAVSRRIDNAHICAVASRNKEKGTAFAAKHGIPRVFDSCEALAMDPEVDLVYIATPDALHYSQTLFCLEHGKHVLCEKPFAMNVTQAKEMIAAARQRGLLLADGMWPCYMPMAETLRNIVRTGILGKVSTLTGNLHYIGQPKVATSGIFLSNGIYLLSLAVMLFGRNIRRIIPAAIKTDSGIDEQTSVTLVYDDAMSILNCGMRAGSDRRAYLYGDKAFAVIDNANEYKSVDIFSVSPQLSVPNMLIANHSMQSGYDHEMRACLAAIERGDCEPAERSHAETLCVMEVVDTVHKMLGISY